MLKTKMLLNQHWTTVDWSWIDSNSIYEVHQRTIKQLMTCWLPKDTANHMKVKGNGIENVLLYAPCSTESIIHSWTNVDVSHELMRIFIDTLWNFQERENIIVEWFAKVLGSVVIVKENVLIFILYIFLLYFISF